MYTTKLFVFVCVLVANSQQFVLDSTATKTGFSHNAVGLPGPLSDNPLALGLHYPGYNKPYYNPVGQVIPILSYANDHPGDGSYSFSFTTADGKQVEESGFLKDEYIDNSGEPQGTQVVRGSYSYISPDGTPVQVSYTADENGFRASGVQISSDENTIPIASNFRRDNNNIVDSHQTGYNRFGRRHSFNYDLHNQYQHSQYNQRHHSFQYDESKYNLNDQYNRLYNRNIRHNSWLNNTGKN